MDGEPNGAVEIQMKWRYMYIPPKISAKTKEQVKMLCDNKHDFKDTRKLYFFHS